MKATEHTAQEKYEEKKQIRIRLYVSLSLSISLSLHTPFIFFRSPFKLRPPTRRTTNIKFKSHSDRRLKTAKNVSTKLSKPPSHLLGKLQNFGFENGGAECFSETI